MNGWTSEELAKIDTAEELNVRSLRRDGTLRSPTTIWVVRHGEDLYVRPVNGRTSGWFRGTQVRQEGHIQCGGVAQRCHVRLCRRGRRSQRRDRCRVPRQVPPLPRQLRRRRADP